MPLKKKIYHHSIISAKKARETPTWLKRSAGLQKIANHDLLLGDWAIHLKNIWDLPQGSEWKVQKISETTSSVLSSHPKKIKTTRKTLTSQDRILFSAPLGWLDASLGCCGIVPPRLKSNGKNLEIVWENELDLFFLGANFEVNGFKKKDQPSFKKYLRKWEKYFDLQYRKLLPCRILKSIWLFATAVVSKKETWAAEFFFCRDWETSWRIPEIWQSSPNEPCSCVERHMHPSEKYVPDRTPKRIRLMIQKFLAHPKC